MHPHLGEGVTEILLNCERVWLGEEGRSYFRGFCVDVINVCSLYVLIRDEWPVDVKYDRYHHMTYCILS